MCGIAGVFSLDKNKELKQSDARVIIDMLSQMKNRGPDENGIHLEKDYAVGHARLKIVGDDTGKQPIKENGNCLVFNGEIYNYKDLKTDLNLNDSILSDTYILFKFLQKNPINSINQLNGMFSFCYITDDYISLVRDRFGKKPLFYTIKNDILYFASEMKAFLNIIDFTLNITDIYTALETEIGKNTIFKDIFQLEPGSYLRFNRRTKEIKKIKYYFFTTSEETHMSEKQLLEKLRYLVTDAAVIRSDTDKKFGCYVSGGIDSSIIALLVKPKYLFTFLPKSNIIPDEEKYVDIISTRLPTAKLTKIETDSMDFLSQFINVVYMNEGPTTTLAAYSQYLLAKEVKQCGIRIMLSGLGADEFISGYARHAIAYVPEKYFSSSLFDLYVPLIQKSGMNDVRRKDLLYTNLIKRNDGENKHLLALVTEIFQKYPSKLTAMSICDSLFTLPPLLHTDDHMNMAFSIESRSPFMDYRLIEFALSLPENKKIKIDKQTNQVYTKYLLREAFKDILPKEIYERKDKIGFSSNVIDLLRNNMKNIFSKSLVLLQKDYPDVPYFLQNESLYQKYSRYEYQIVQLAITHLLFTKKYLPEAVNRYFTGI